MSIENGRRFWSIQPPKRVRPPVVRDGAWPRRRIDRFVLAKLEANDLAPSVPADRRTLIRRVTFDLLGLPPTPSDVDAFVSDHSADPYATLIDRLLASPAYGEHWARFWLDKVRYTDTVPRWTGTRAFPWLYRDWVIRAFNDDLPYDAFVKRQLAADLMPSASPEDIPALGFLGLGPVYWKELKLDKSLVKTVIAEEWEERMDAIGRTYLGLTLACARCHDHKFDPVTTDDYYAIAGVLASTRVVDRPMLPVAEWTPIRRAHEQARPLEKEVERVRKIKSPSPEDQRKLADAERELAALKEATPGFDTPLARAVEDASLYVLDDGPNHTRLDYRPGQARDLHVHIRGNPSNPGRLVERRFLAVLSNETPRPLRRGSGRLDLAEALVEEGAPLTARVIVNRVWQQHFGVGLVDTPSNFGVLGSRPTHPALLDDLTARFIENGWSIKWLHREILSSATYRQSGRPRAKERAIDPDNRLLWRMAPRRLDIEPWRDAVLTVTGRLDRRRGGPPGNLDEVTNRRRTIYGTVNRRQVSAMLRLHDFPPPSGHSPQRLATTTPLQQLFVLNSDFIWEQATALLDRLKREAPSGFDLRVGWVYQWLFARPATAPERDVARRFLAEQDEEAGGGDKAWTLYLQALLGANEFAFVN